MKHRLAFLASIAVPVALSLFFLLLIPASHRHDDVLSWAKICWFTGIVFVVTNAVGLMFGRPKDLRPTPWHPAKRLIVTYVSRGDNETALRRAIAATKLILEDSGVRYVIEAITDMPVSVGADRHLLVPADYETPHGAKYKARALEYGRFMRSFEEGINRNTWILHLDEESIVTPEAMSGIADYISKRENANTIGQGEIKYNAHKYGENLLITSIDSLRTGDDLGRFRFQYRVFGKPLFGMHGSFILVPARLEEEIGFDLGGRGSITEDAYFALTAADKGIRFGWVEGYIREQSPFTLLALLKQRRRWITGLRLLVFDKSISRRQRIMLGVNMTLWRAAWIGPVVTFWNVIAGGSLVPTSVSIAGSIASGMVGVVYMMGAYRNIAGANLTQRRQILIWVSSLVLVPICCMIEGVAVLYSIVSPVEVFDVVAK